MPSLKTSLHHGISSGTKQTIAITGAAGYIGGYMCEYFAARQWHVRGLSRRTGRDLGQRGMHYPFSLEQEGGGEVLCGADILLHCAHDFSCRSRKDSWRINLEGSFHLFREAKAQGVRKILFLSSISAFASSQSIYGQVKYAIEQMGLEFGVISLRAGLVFEERSRGIVGALEQFLRKYRIAPLIGRGNQPFFPCHIEDLARCIEVIIENPKGPCISPILAAAERAVSFRELVHILAQKMGVQAKLFPVPYWMVLYGLRGLELMGISCPLRSDSVKYMKAVNGALDFTPTRELGVKFRGF